MVFSIRPVIPATEIDFESALIATIVIMQVSIEAAKRSVGEKDSPFPWLSTGASVTKIAPDGPCVVVQRKFPSYVAVNFTIFIHFRN